MKNIDICKQCKWSDSEVHYNIDGFFSDARQIRKLTDVPEECPFILEHALVEPNTLNTFGRPIETYCYIVKRERITYITS